MWLRQMKTILMDILWYCYSETIKQTIMIIPFCWWDNLFTIVRVLQLMASMSIEASKINYHHRNVKPWNILSTEKYIIIYGTSDIMLCDLSIQKSDRRTSLLCFPMILDIPLIRIATFGIIVDLNYSV